MFSFKKIGNSSFCGISRPLSVISYLMLCHNINIFEHFVHNICLWINLLNISLYSFNVRSKYTSNFFCTNNILAQPIFPCSSLAEDLRANNNITINRKSEKFKWNVFNASSHFLCNSKFKNLFLNCYIFKPKCFSTSIVCQINYSHRLFMIFSQTPKSFLSDECNFSAQRENNESKTK